MPRQKKQHHGTSGGKDKAAIFLKINISVIGAELYRSRALIKMKERAEKTTQGGQNAGRLLLKLLKLLNISLSA